MDIHTNELHATFHFDAIESDFDLYLLTPADDLQLHAGRNSKRTTCCIFDTAQLPWKALASAYNDAGETILLFPSGTVPKLTFLKFASEHFPKFAAKHVSHSKLLDDHFRERHFGKGGRVLVQLFVNRLANFKEISHQFNNTAAHLYEFCKYDTVGSKSYPVYFRAEVTEDMNLRITSRVFTGDRKGTFILDEKTNRFRRVLKSDGDGKRFSPAKRKDGRTILTFLSFDEEENFSESRLGEFVDVVHRVETSLGRYMTWTFSELPQNKIISRDVSGYRKKRQQFAWQHLQDETIWIQNFIGEDGVHATEELTAWLDGHHIRVQTLPPEQSPPCDALSIFILHEKAWYPENEQDDPYVNLHRSSAIVQILTTERWKNNDAIAWRLLDELLIKQDIRCGYFSQKADLSSFTKPWTFVWAAEVAEDGDEDTTFLVYNGMKLYPDGKMEFSRFDDHAEKLPSTQKRIQRIYHSIPGYGLITSEESIAGICYCDPKNPHTIIRTGTWILPNLDAIQKALREFEGTEIEKDALLQWMDAYADDHPTEKAVIGETRQRLEEHLPDTFYPTDFKKLVSSRAGWIKDFERKVYAEHHVLLQPFFKSTTEQNRKYLPMDYQMDALTSIHAVSHERNVGGIPQLVHGYFSGLRKQGLKQAVPRGSFLYDIVPADEGNDQSAEVLPLLDVDFVMSNDMHTVLPFPFKYLREYHDIMEFKKSESCVARPSGSGENMEEISLF